jgi:hypothetical protein
MQSLTASPALPAQQLPSHQDILLDLAEYWCHVCLVAATSTPPDQYLDHNYEQLSQVLQQIGPIRRYGRLYSRMQIYALAADALAFLREAAAHISALTDTTNARSTTNSTRINNLVDKWQRFAGQLQLVRNHLLRANANKRVPTEVQVPPHSVAALELVQVQQDDQIDEALCQHAMFQDDFDTLVQQVRVQVVVLTLVMRLQCILEQDENRDAIAQVEQAVDSYQHELQTLFMPDTAVAVPVAEDDEDHDDDDDYNDEQRRDQAAFDEGNSTVPAELIHFVRRVLLRSGAASPFSSKAVVQELLQQVRRLLLEPPHEYSHLQLQSKVRMRVVKRTGVLVLSPAPYFRFARSSSSGNPVSWTCHISCKRNCTMCPIQSWTRTTTMFLRSGTRRPKQP